MCVCFQFFFLFEAPCHHKYYSFKFFKCLNKKRKKKQQILLSAPFGIKKKFVCLPNLSHDFLSVVYHFIGIIKFHGTFYIYKGKKGKKNYGNKSENERTKERNIIIMIENIIPI